VKLRIYRDDKLERTVELPVHDLRIGRGAENDLVLEDAGKTVSRFHAELRIEGDQYVVIDLNSQNGTWIDGRRVQRAAVAPGTTIALGHFRLVIEGGAPSGSAHQPAGAALGRTVVMPKRGGDQPAAGAAAAAGAGPPRAVASKRPRLTEEPDSKRRAGAAAIPRPIFYGASLAFLALVVGIMYVMRPQPVEMPPEDVGAAEAPAGPESNAQIIERELRIGREKLTAGDTVAAIEAFTRALLVDPNHPEALDLKVKAEEKRFQNEQAKKAAEDAARAAAEMKPPATEVVPPKAATTGRQPPSAPGPAPIKQAPKRPPPVPAVDTVSRPLAQGKTALAAGQYRAAIAAFETVLKEQPNHAEAAALLAQATAGSRKEAVAAAGRGDALAAQGDLAGALKEYDRARQLDPASTAATAGISAVRSKMKASGDDAYRRGRQLEAVGRLQDAMVQYQRAVELLPADDPNGKAARERLENLRRQP
jgi:tetratricopeptide (TPR) repeat protein